MRRTVAVLGLGVLIGILFPIGFVAVWALFAQQPQQSGEKVALTILRIAEVKAALEALRRRRPANLDIYPPSDIRELRDGAGNQPFASLDSLNNENLGIESLVVAIRMARIEFCLEEGLAEGFTANTDGDFLPEGNAVMNSLELSEFVDAWGNPLAYFSPPEAHTSRHVSRYRLATGKLVEVSPQSDSLTGIPRFCGKYQLISAGPDCVFGTADDLGAR